jgi:hypothetical protein
MRFSKKLAAVAIVAASAVTATAAFAYWTTTGSGTGSGSAAAGNGTIVLHASIPAGIAPGTSVTVGYSADNASATDLAVGTVSAVVSTSSVDCLPAWFSIAPVTENQTIAHTSNGVALSNSGTLVFKNDAANQDACKSATISLALSSN